MKKRFTEDQIISAVKKLEAGMTAKELSRELGVTLPALWVLLRSLTELREEFDSQESVA